MPLNLSNYIEAAEISYNFKINDLTLLKQSWGTVVAAREGTHSAGSSTRQTLSAITFKTGGTSEPTGLLVAFRGTVPSNSGHRQDDWDITMGRLPTEFEMGVKFVKEMMAFHGVPRNKIVLAGHSLGGSLAQSVGAAQGINFISFNGPGVANAYVKRFNPPSAVNNDYYKLGEGWHPTLSLLITNRNGVNIINANDTIGNWGQHIGRRICEGGHGHLLTAHALDSLREIYKNKLNTDPFGINF